MLVILQILTLLLSISNIVRGSNEPLMDILNYYDKISNISELCDKHLSVLKNGIESEEVWALKGEIKIVKRAKFNEIIF